MWVFKLTAELRQMEGPTSKVENRPIVTTPSRQGSRNLEWSYIAAWVKTRAEMQLLRRPPYLPDGRRCGPFCPTTRLRSILSHTPQLSVQLHSQPGSAMSHICRIKQLR